MIEENIFDNELGILIDEAISKVKDIIKEFVKPAVSINKKSIVEALDSHLKIVQRWSVEIKFKDLSKSKSTSSIYVDLDYYIGQKRLNISNIDPKEKSTIKEIIENNHNIVILGQPGAGKTTSMKFLCQELLHKNAPYLKKFKFPLVIRFRDLNYESQSKPQSIIFKELWKILGLNFNFRRGNVTIDNPKSLLEKTVISFLDKLSPLIIFDGLDEILDSSLKELIYHELNTLTNCLENAKIIITTRTGEFDREINNTEEYEICELSESQIKKFIKIWLIDPDESNELFIQLKKSPFFDTTIRPLTLAHLTAIYQREGKIPEKPKTVYKKVINLLLEEWNTQQGIKRISRFVNFDEDRKFDFLSYLAYQLTIKYKKNVFSESDLKDTYLIICDNFGLSPYDVIKVVHELESQNGLFIQTGYETFQFPHKSIQEYLTADFLIKLYELPELKFLKGLPNELALAVSIASIPSKYFANIVLKKFAESISDPQFIAIFLNRLILEKPDFQANPIFGVSFVYIYHKVIGSNGSGISTNEYIKKVDNYLDNLFNSNVTIQESIQSIQNYYIITGKKGPNYSLIRNTTKLEDDIFRYLIPNTLISKSSYFKSTYNYY